MDTHIQLHPVQVLKATTLEGHNSRGTKVGTRNNCLKLLWEVTRSNFEQQEERRRHLGLFAKSSSVSAFPKKFKKGEKGKGGFEV